MICTDLHSCLASILAKYDPDQVAVVMDVKASGKWTNGESSLTFNPSPLTPHLLPLQVSEETKNIATVQQIWDFLLEKEITRRGVLVCIGGGVLTDLGGFAAATYKRGIAYINVPTTLLAMVDASTGGKTGFNYGGLKNSIGVFLPPEAIIIYPPFLDTLPSHEWLSGYAEMLKTGLLDNSGRLWDRLLQYDLESPVTHTLSPLIADCIAVKERIVASDPKESGMRKALNLGHTFGHAIEELSHQHAASGNPPMAHGYAVLYGLIAELYLSVILLGCPREPLQQLTQLMIQYYGKPQCKCSDLEQLVALMHQDKKNEHAAEINCTLLRAVGDPVINYTISDSQAIEAWEYLFSL